MIGGRAIIRLDRVSSTMDIVDEYARAGAAEGLVVVAEEQSAGRGRTGRAWLAPPGSAILCSLLLRPTVPPDRLGALPLLLGVAVAEAIEAVADVTCQLKWPNDVLIERLKVAGILVQSRLKPRGIDFAIAGIGINVSTAAAALPPGATSIAIQTENAVSRETLLTELLGRIDQQYAQFIATDGRPSLDPWRRRAAMIGERVTVLQEQGELEGVFNGVDEVGRLLLDLGAGEKRALIHGELLRGPRST